MLTLTDNASAILQQISTQTEGEDVALRIESVEGEEAGFGISAATEPVPGDQVVEQGGATVYVDPTAAVTLDNAVLDAGVDETGNVQFALGQQG